MRSNATGPTTAGSRRPMPPESPDEVIDAGLLARVGRNLLAFQRVELDLKKLLSFNGQAYLIPLGGESVGPTLAAPDHGRESLRGRQRERDRQMLGLLIGEYVTAIVEGRECADAPLPAGHARLSIRIHAGMSAAEADACRRSLSVLVEERNELVHHFAQRLSSSPPDETCAWLDAQYERTLGFQQDLRSLSAAMAEGLRAFAGYAASPRFHDDFEQAWLRQSLLVQAFAAIAGRIARKDGWAAYSRAAQLARELCADELAALRERYGHAKAIDALRASGLFVFREEATPRGGRRLLYRTNPDLAQILLPAPQDAAPPAR